MINPIEVSNLDIAFATTVSHLMPAVPKEFNERGENKKYFNIVDTWFYKGLNKGALIAKHGVDREKAIRHLKAILNSFEPAHEDKRNTVAYLISLWFEIK